MTTSKPWATPKPWSASNRQVGERNVTVCGVCSKTLKWNKKQNKTEKRKTSHWCSSPADHRSAPVCGPDVRPQPAPHLLRCRQVAGAVPVVQGQRGGEAPQTDDRRRTHVTFPCCIFFSDHARCTSHTMLPHWETSGQRSPIRAATHGSGCIGCE